MVKSILLIVLKCLLYGILTLTCLKPIMFFIATPLLIFIFLPDSYKKLHVTAASIVVIVGVFPTFYWSIYIVSMVSIFLMANLYILNEYFKWNFILLKYFLIFLFVIPIIHLLWNIKIMNFLTYRDDVFLVAILFVVILVLLTNFLVFWDLIVKKNKNKNKLLT